MAFRKDFLCHRKLVRAKTHQHDLICHLIKRLAFPGGSFLIREFKLIYYLKIQITWIQMVADLPPPILRKSPQPTRPERDQDQALPALHG